MHLKSSTMVGKLFDEGLLDLSNDSQKWTILTMPGHISISQSATLSSTHCVAQKKSRKKLEWHGCSQHMVSLIIQSVRSTPVLKAPWTICSSKLPISIIRWNPISSRHLTSSSQNFMFTTGPSTKTWMIFDPSSFSTDWLKCVSKSLWAACPRNFESQYLTLLAFRHCPSIWEFWLILLRLSSKPTTLYSALSRSPLSSSLPIRSNHPVGQALQLIRTQLKFWCNITVSEHLLQCDI